MYKSLLILVLTISLALISFEPALAQDGDPPPPFPNEPVEEVR